MQTGFLKGPEMSGSFIPGIPLSTCPKYKTSSQANNTAIQSVPRPISMPSLNQQVTQQIPKQQLSSSGRPIRSSDTSKSPFSTISSRHYPVPKVGRISSVSRSTTPVISMPSTSPCLHSHIECTLVTGDLGKTKPSSLKTANPSDSLSQIIPNPVNTSVNMGHKHAHEILGKSYQNIQFTLRPNKFNSLLKFGNQGKKNHNMYIFHPRHRKGHHRLPKSPPSTNILHRHETIYPNTIPHHRPIIT